MVLLRGSEVRSLGLKNINNKIKNTNFLLVGFLLITSDLIQTVFFWGGGVNCPLFSFFNQYPTRYLSGYLWNAYCPGDSSVYLTSVGPERGFKNVNWICTVVLKSGRNHRIISKVPTSFFSRQTKITVQIKFLIIKTIMSRFSSRSLNCQYGPAIWPANPAVHKEPVSRTHTY